MIAAVIPTRYSPPQLPILLSQLAVDGVEPIVLRSENYDHRIYRMWNVGTEQARSLGATEIAILNDDIGLLQGTLPLMAEALRADDSLGVVYPDINATWTLPRKPQIQPTEGTWGAGGMTGFCFMFKAEPHIPFDEGFHWWYGDDQYERNVREVGYTVARLVGVPIQHVANSSASKDWERLAPLIDEDRRNYEARNAVE